MSQKTYPPSLKFRIVLDVIGGKTQAQVARQFGIDHRLVSKWYKTFVAKGKEIFSNGECSRKISRLENKIKQLEQIIGKKEIEIMFLKNFLEPIRAGS